MKKFMITCYVLTIVFFVSGFTMLGIAVMKKGPSVIDATQKKTLEVIGMLDKNVTVRFGKKPVEGSELTTLKGQESMSFSKDEIQGLNVEIGAGKLFIVASEDEAVHVKNASSGNCIVYVENGILHVETMNGTSIGANITEIGENGLNVDVNMPTGEVYLYLPADASFREAELSLGAGTLKSDVACVVEELELEVAAGEMTLTNMEASDFTCKIGAGRLNYTGAVLANADVECGMGEAKLTLDGAQSDYDYALDVAAGEVAVGDKTYSGLAGSFAIDNNADKKVNVVCAVGKVVLEF